MCKYSYLITLLFYLTALSAKSEAAPTDLQWVSEEPKPQWIWRANKTDNEPIYFRKSFEAPTGITSAILYATCDNGADVYLNGKKVGTAADWGAPIILKDAAKHLEAGHTNALAVKARNRGGLAAFVFKLEMEHPGGKAVVISDPSWKMNLSRHNSHFSHTWSNNTRTIRANKSNV